MKTRQIRRVLNSDVIHGLSLPQGLLLVTLAIALLLLPARRANAEALATGVVRQDGSAATYIADGIVEAVRQTTVSAQVPGVISKLAVKAGDTVKPGQLLVQIDARAADQVSAASHAQAEAARTTFEVAKKDYERQKQLYENEYISPAAMERAEAQYRAAQAQANAATAQSVASRTQSGFYTVTAPYGGIVATVDVTFGDMAMPGKTLLTIYDPAALRVTASVAEARVPALSPAAKARIEVPGLSGTQRWIEAASMQILPSADPTTHTMQVRLELPPATTGVRPGAFARAHLPVAETGRARLFVPAGALFRRSEMSAVYVLDASGNPRLRQVRPGPALGDEVEILSGLSAGERVALDPIAAAQRR